MTERVQIIVEAQDSASGILRGITSNFGELGSLIEDLASPTQNWGNITASAVSAVIDFTKEAVDATVIYANSVRDLSAISGESAENTSRFIQVLDDYQLSAQDAETATRFLTKNGYAPTIETLAQLSDKYLALTSAQERNDFVLQNLGRSGLQWVNLLKQGGDALREQGAAVKESLVLTQEQLDATEQYRLQLDGLQDQLAGLKTEIGTGIIPQLTDLFAGINALADKTSGLGKVFGWLINPIDNVAGALSEWDPLNIRVALGLEDVADGATNAADATDTFRMKDEDLNAALVPTEQQLKDITQEYKSLISSMQDMQKETDRYTNAQEDANEAIRQADKDLAAGKISVEQHDKIIAESTKRLDENARAHQQWAAQTIFSFAQARAAADGNITEGEGQILIDMGEKLGLFDRQTADAMEAVNKAFDSVDSGNAQEMIDAMYESLLKLTGTTWIIPVEYGGPSPEDYIIPPHESTDALAAGGPAYAGTSYLVGERGPELFMPTQDGTVIPNNQLQMNYFYGPTSLVISGDGADGLLGLRV